MSKKNKKPLLIILMIVGVIAAMTLYYLVFYPLLNIHKYPLAFLTLENEPEKLVAVYYLKRNHPSQEQDSETGRTYSPSYESIIGYKLELVNPMNGKVISSLRIKKRPDEISNTHVFMTTKGELYLVFIPSSVSESKAFTEVFTIKGDSIIQLPEKDLEGFAFTNVYPDYALLKNEYNETRCLNFKTGEFTDGNCDQMVMNKKNQAKDSTQFFFVPNSQESTRYFPHFLKYIPDDDFYAGSTGDDLRQSMFNPFTMDLSYNPGELTMATGQEITNRTQNKIRPPELLRQITGKDGQPLLLNTPEVLLENDTLCLLTSTAESKTWLYCLSTTKMLWKCEMPAQTNEKEPISLQTTHGRYIIRSPVSWVLCLDAGGNTLWKYPK